MSGNDGSLSFSIKLEIDKVQQQIAQLQRGFDQMATRFEADGSRMDGVIDGITDRLKQLGAAWSAKEFAQKVMETRGQFQQLEMAFTTMLQSGEKANALMQQLVKTAATTPFDLTGVANGAKQLLAYGVEADNVNSTLIRLGDIAAGLSIPLGDLVYLYGTTMAQGRLYTQDLNQFTGRGIPMIQELAKQFGVADSEVKKLVEEGKVGFPEVQKVIESLTDKGGKFGGLMEAQSKTITGQIANIEDAIDTMFNDIGQSQEGIINAGLDIAGQLVENWRKVGEAVMVAATAYGSYKAVLMGVTAYQAIEARLLGQIAVEKSLAAAAGIQLSNAEAMAAARTKLLTLAQQGLATALKKTAAATLANPYVLAAAAITGLAYAVYKWATADSAAEAAQKSLQRALDKTAEAQQKYNEETAKAIDIAKDDAAATIDRDDALRTLIRRYPSIIQKYIDEKGHLRDVLALKKEIAEYDGKKQRKETADTLKKEADDARTQYGIAASLLGKSKAGQGLTRQEQEQATALRRQYAADTDTPFWQVNLGTSLGDIREFYRNKMGTSQRQYRRKLTENRISDFTADGGKLESMDDKALAALQKRLREANAKKNEHTAVFIQELDDYLTLNDRQDLLTRVDAMVKARNEPKKTDDGKDGKGGKTGDDEAKKRLEAQETLNEQLRQLQQQNTDAEIALMQDGAEKKLAEMRNGYKKQLSEIDRQEAEFRKKNKEAGNKGGLTEEQAGALNEARMLAKQDYDKQIEEAEKEAHKTQLESMRDYLKEYGTYQQQKLAIAEEYAEKIKAVNESADSAEAKAWKVKSLEAERDKATRQTELAAIKQRIDWGSVFGDFGAMFKDQLQPTIDDLRRLANSDEFKAATLEEKQTLYGLIDKLEQANTVWDGDIFKRVSDDLMAYQSAMAGYAAAQERERKATVALAEAKERLRKAETGGDEVGADIAKAEVRRASAELDQASASVQAFGAKVEQTSTEVQASSQQAANQLTQLKEGLSGLTSGSLAGVAKAFAQIDKLFGGGDLEKNLSNTLAKGMQTLFGKDSKAAQTLNEALGSSGLAGEIISAILGIFDMIAQSGVSGIVASLSDTVLGAVDGILDDVLSGDIITKSLESVGSGVRGILNTLTFGGLDSWAGGDSDKTLHEDLARLAETNEELQKVMQNLSDTMANASIINSKQVYELQRQNIKARQDNTKESMRRAADASSKGFLGFGSKASSYAKMNEGMSAEGWAKVSAAAGASVKTAQDFFSLTSEQMYNVAQYATSQYLLLKDLANDGKEDAAQYMDDYIGYWKELKEVEEAYYEHLTTVSFDTVVSDFRNALLDMDSEAEDFADNFEKYMQQAIVESLLVDQYKPLLETWYKNFAKFQENDGKLDEGEVARLQKEMQDITDAALAGREELKKVFGWDTTSSGGQSSTTTSAASLTEDTGKAIEGRFTAMQISADAMRATLASMQADIGGLGASATAIMQNTAEMRNISLTAIDHLESIAKNTHELYEMNERLGKIEKNTRSI